MPRKARSSSRWRRRAGRDQSWPRDAPDLLRRARGVDVRGPPRSVLTRLETVKASAPFSIKRRRSRFSGASAPGRTMQCSLAVDRASRSAASRAPRKPVAPVRRILLPSRRPTPDCPIPGRTSSGRTASANICSKGSDWSGCVDERGAEPSIHAASSRIVMDSCARSGGTSTPRASSTAAVSSMTPNESAPRSDRGATTSSTRRRRRSVPDAADRRTDSVSDSRAVLDAGQAGIMPSSPAATPRRKHPTVQSWAAIRIAHFSAGIPLDLPLVVLGRAPGARSTIVDSWMPCAAATAARMLSTSADWTRA